MQDRLFVDENHPVIGGHWVNGEALLPGLAYIDLLMQLFREHGYHLADKELHALSIYRPLTVAAGEGVWLVVDWEWREDDVWHVHIRGVPSEQSEASSTQYASAEIRPTGADVGGEIIDWPTIQAEAGPSMPLAQVYERSRERGLVHSPFMQLNGQVFRAGDDYYAECAVSDSARPSAANSILHPAIADGAALALGEALRVFGDEPDSGRLYLPLYYEAFRHNGPVGDHCIVRLRPGSLWQREELLTLSLDIFNDRGEKTAELINLTSKMVADADADSEAEASRDVGVSAEAVAAPAETGAGDRRAAIIAYLRSVVAEQLGVAPDSVAADAGYYELGLGSAGLLEVVVRIGERVGASLPPTLPFEYTTLEALADYLEAHYGSCFESFAGPDAETNAGSEAGRGGTSPTAASEQATDAAATTAADPAVAAANGDVGGSASPADAEPIAIVGMSGRFPEADDLEAFWDNLVAGRDCVSEVPAERWSAERLEGLQSPSGKAISRWGGFLADPARFDPHFFRIAPLEAEAMDPQERQFLEVCWEALEDAGHTPSTLVPERGSRRRVGVFAGVMHNDYALLGAQASAEGEPTSVSLSNASVANRVSYVCDFHGPSLTVDTVCSSSLTALHLALTSLQRGESDAALAGGVNLSLHPQKYISYGMLDMHASDGRCRAFGADGDGYVSAEGVGAVALKRLSRAEADGDPVYAVIRGGAVNHVGSVSGFTVPSPDSQAELVARCLEEAGVAPETVSYVEAHGTGTSLGDPIEIDGLSRVFGDGDSERPYCAIGSVKSNIGHAESAAGISGLIKVALQLRHRWLVPSLHAEPPNPHVDWSKSPFAVTTEGGRWLPPRDESGKELPLRAGLSSLGATGSNAHFLLEQAPVRPSGQSSGSGPHVVVLSAKSEAQLRAYAQRLLSHCQRHEPELAPMAYTLQFGRVELRHRLALVVSDPAGLEAGLAAYVGGDTGFAGLYTGKAEASAAGQAALVPESGPERTQAELERLAAGWVAGQPVLWSHLYPPDYRRRVSLPTYPFAGDRYWLDFQGEPGVMGVAAGGPERLHPLVHRNSSDLDELRFSSTFGADDRLLRDYGTGSRQYLPPLAALEMARGALSVASPGATDGILVYDDIAFSLPALDADGSLDVHVALVPQGDDAVEFEVYTGAFDSGEVCAAGTLSWGVQDQEATAADWNEAVANCDYKLDAAEFYDRAATWGSSHGPSYQVVSEIHLGEAMAAASLALPDSDSDPGLALSPYLLEGLAQAAAALNAGGEGGQRPLSLAKLVLRQSLPQQLRAVLHCPGRDAAINIDLLDNEGRLCARLERLTVGAATSNAAVGEAAQAAASNIDLVLAEPRWLPQPLPEPSQSAEGRDHLVFLGGNLGHLETVLPRWLPNAHCVRLGERSAAIDSDYIEAGAQLLASLQERLSQQSSASLMVQLITPNQDEQALLGGLGALLKSAQVEYPELKIQSVGVDIGEDGDVLAEQVSREANSSSTEIRYHAGRREERSVVRRPPENPTSPWRDGGIYLITGGAGGLGRVFAAAIARSVRDPVVVLTGRSALTPERERELNDLLTPGARWEYRAVDVSNADAVDDLVREVRRDHGAITGVIHAAGVLRDSFAAEKTLSDFRAVMAPKVAGIHALDQATREDPLDAFILFSSTAGLFGNVGQTDYAAANAFIDGFADYRRGLRDRGERHGRSLSVNWPLWAGGGMQVDEANLERLWRSVGMAPLPEDMGIAALSEAFAGDSVQVAVLAGDANRIESRLLDSGAEPEPSVPTASTGAGWRAEFKGLSLSECVLWDLKEQASTQLKLDRENIDPAENLTEFGFDSITLTRFANQLSDHFGLEVTPAIFFSYPTLNDLAGYFLNEYASALDAFYSPGDTAGSGQRSAAPAGPEKASTDDEARPRKPRRRSSSRRRSSASNNTQPSEAEPIAVIGMSGRFPEARNIDDFWSTLRDGEETVTEVSPERFDISPYYSDSEGDGGQTKCKWFGQLPGVAEFDPLFFEISPVEAETMDPRQRLLMQQSWAALEDAGYGDRHLADHTIGTFVGVEQGDYAYLVGDQGDITGNHDGVLAARLAYFLNLQGPTFALNTACSSGLVALHQACLSLRAGECDTAIAAGANLLLTPESLVWMDNAGMLSQEGRCYTFDERANGMVPGEAVISIVLKPLARAEADGDPIHGVIQASGVNYDGRTNGITAPSGASQVRLLRDVYHRHSVDPGSIDYVVAHGTGTRLGDPIEVNALNQVFGESSSASPASTALTSTKTNVGHTQAASGLVSLVGLLQAMRHEQIPPSLHCQRESDYIQWSSSPFYVNKALTSWPAGHRPRLGAVSAFGISGTNAHAVVSSYEQAEARGPASAFHLLVVSAKTRDALERRVADLEAELAAGEWPSEALAAMSYTLLVGRQHFRERAAFVVADRDDALRLLGQFGSRRRAANEFAGTVPHDFEPNEAMTWMASELMDRAATSDAATYRQQLAALAELYCQGYALPWERLFQGQTPRRIRLPSYPFAREEHWVEQTADHGGAKAHAPIADMQSGHPLLQANHSGLMETRFGATFTGDEFFLRDHVVNGSRVLPAVVYLEMVRAAVRAALSPQAYDGAVVRLEQIVFSEPVVVGDEPIEVQVSLELQDDDGIAFTVHTASPDGARRHAQGVVRTSEAREVPSVDIDQLRGRCDYNFSGAECYERFDSMGLSYGLSHQPLDGLSVSSYAGGSAVVVADLRQPDGTAEPAYTLHPSMLDGALQASIGFALREGALPDEPLMPFALDEVTVFSDVPANAVAVVHDVSASEELQKLNVDVVDPVDGQVCARMKGFTARSPKREDSEQAIQRETLLVASEWHAQQPNASDEAEVGETCVVLAGVDSSVEAVLAERMPQARPLRLSLPDTIQSERYTEAGSQLLAYIRAVFAEVSGMPPALQLVVPHRGDDSLLEGLGGFMRSLWAELPQTSVQVLSVDPDMSAEAIADTVRQEAGSGVSHVRFGGGVREVQGLTVVDQPETSSPWRDEGVYLITGGSGGLGSIFAEAIAEAARSPTLILTGRSPHDADKAEFERALERQGAQAEYHAVDIADAASVNRLVQDIENRHGTLTGIIHSAGLVKDAVVMHKTETELRHVFAPKVQGVQALDEATRHLALEHFILFSSVTSFFGNVGQSDYAAANGFLDAFATRRNELVANGQRSGWTVAVNWPWWAEGGIRVDASARRRAWLDAGLLPLERDDGIAALDRVLASGYSQIAVISADEPRFRARLLGEGGVEAANEAAPSASSASTSDLAGQLETVIKGMVADQLKMDVERVDVEEDLSSYGFDSVRLTTLSNTLNEHYDLGLTPAVLFQYPSVAALSGYLAETYADRLAASLA